MKKIKYILISIIFISILSGCNKEENKELDVSGIKNLFEIATISATYHNTAETTKEGSLLQKERVLWIEYDAIAKIGIDMSKGEIKKVGNEITITIPPAELLDKTIIDLKKENYLYSKDGFIFKNEITPEDESVAIALAQEEMVKQVNNNKEVLKDAQTRAKAFIEKFIAKFGDSTNQKYNIKWIEL